MRRAWVCAIASARHDSLEAMRGRRSLGRRFGWLWAAYAVSTYGTGFGFGAMTIVAIRVLHAGPGQVSLLASVGLAAGALLAIPLGPWVEFRRKRPVMIAMDLVRFGAQTTTPAEDRRTRLIKKERAPGVVTPGL